MAAPRVFHCFFWFVDRCIGNGATTRIDEAPVCLKVLLNAETAFMQQPVVAGAQQQGVL